MKNVILACGLQRAYFNKQGSRYLGEKSEILKIRLIDFFQSMDLSSYVVFFMREIHRADDIFFQGQKTYGIVGTPDIEIPEVFKPFAKFIINTSRYSGMYRTAFESELNKIRPKEIHIVGVETHTTVLFTAEELRNRGYHVIGYEPLMLSEDDFLHSLGINMLSNVLSVDIR